MKIIYPLQSSWLDYPDPISTCLSLYVVGCEHKCPDCSSPMLQDFNYEANNVVDLSDDKKQYYMIRKIENDLDKSFLINRQIGFPTESSEVVYPTKNLPVFSISVYLLNYFLFFILLIIIQISGNLFV